MTKQEWFNAYRPEFQASYLCRRGLLLPSGITRQEAPPPPALVEKPRYTMILSGHWRRVRVVDFDRHNNINWICVDTGYGVRWFSREYIVYSNLVYAGLQRTGVVNALAA